jgi:pleiotropic regulator 1
MATDVSATMVDAAIRHRLNTHALFAQDYTASYDDSAFDSTSALISRKTKYEYRLVMNMPAPAAAAAAAAKKRKAPTSVPDASASTGSAAPSPDLSLAKEALRGDFVAASASSSSTALVARDTSGISALTLPVRKAPRQNPPKWHAPWKLKRVVSGHTGWVRCVNVDVSNEWFVTGGADRTIKIWDLASGVLKLTLTGHVSAVRGVCVSDRHPYMFSCGEDKLIKCWDLESNKVIRHYHGHLSGIYEIAMHPTVDVIITGSRDSSARVWDIRTKNCVHVLSGHGNTVCSILTQPTDPQVITGSHDSQIKLWDLVAGKCYSTLTHHKKSVRGMALHPTKYMFASASSDNIKQWKCPEGTFVQNMAEGPQEVINDIAINPDGVLVSVTDTGKLNFWDFDGSHRFQTLQTKVQPGSLDAEAGIFACTFDKTGTRLMTCEADKTIKVWAEDTTATPESFPMEWAPKIPNAMGRF